LWARLNTVNSQYILASTLRKGSRYVFTSSL
jgi:hypothetical protein